MTIRKVQGKGAMVTALHACNLKKGTESSGRSPAVLSPEAGPPKEWVRSVTGTKGAPANVELIADVTASNGANCETSDFSKATGGCWSRRRAYDRSNHLKNSKPTGTNVLFVDGHVDWRPFKDMEHRWFRQSNGPPRFWW